MVNICKIHKIEMKMIGFERGYRIYECPICNYDKIKKKKDKKC